VRIENALNMRLNNSEIGELIYQIQPDQIPTLEPGWLSKIKSVQKNWLPNLMSEIPRYNAKQQRATKLIKSKRIKQKGLGLSDPWYINQSDFSIRYQPTGHYDNFIKSWLELTGRYYGSSAPASTIFDLLSEPFESPGKCIKCHHVIESEEIKTVKWQESSSADKEGNLTFFSHRPHLILDCQKCHVSDTEFNFEPLSKTTCADCHTEEKVGDNCLICHRYHVDNFFSMNNDEANN